MFSAKVDVAVVGAGILGLAHAYHAARRGLSVAVFERSPKAMGASIRNFGMVWPIGQPAGDMHQLALRSRSFWIEILTEAGIPFQPGGSLHVAYRADEAAVAQEFAELGPGLGYECAWLDRAATLQRSHAVQPEGLLGALWSPTEVIVDPRQVIGTMPDFLRERYGVQFHFGTPVRAIDLPRIETPAGVFEAARAIVCGGDDFETLYPEQFRAAGVTRCKLQMLRTAAQPDGWRLGPALAGGLTLRYYSSFAVCPSLAAYKSRVAAESPEYDRWHIHVMVSQTPTGELTIGDSHEYGLAVDIFDKPEIDELILRYLRTFLLAPDMNITQRWHGVYAKHMEQPFVRFTPQPGVEVLAVTSGIGMTLSFGLAEATLSRMEIGSHGN